MIYIYRRSFKQNTKKRGNNIEQQFQKLRMPYGDEIFGRVTKLLGATKFNVNCSDGKERICGVPGKFKRRFFIKSNDIVIIKPWSVQSDERGDIVYKYSFIEVNKLKETKNLEI